MPYNKKIAPIIFVAIIYFICDKKQVKNIHKPFVINELNNIKKPRGVRKCKKCN